MSLSKKTIKDNIEHIFLDNINDIDEIIIKGLDNVKTITIKNCKYVNDINLQNLLLLTKVVIDNMNISLNFNSYFPNLHNIKIKNSTIKDFEIDTNIRNVKHVYIKNVVFQHNIEFSSNLNKLEFLLINNTNINGISFVKAIDNLKVLDLYNNLLEDVEFTNPLYNLEYINLARNKIDVFSLDIKSSIFFNNKHHRNIPLFSIHDDYNLFSKVKYLNLEYNNMTEFYSRVNFESLQFLGLEGNNFNNITLTNINKSRIYELVYLTLDKHTFYPSELYKLIIETLEFYKSRSISNTQLQEMKLEEYNSFNGTVNRVDNSPI